MHREGMENERAAGIMAEVQRRRELERAATIELERVDLVIFTLAGDYFAFSGGDVREILSYEKITFVPGCPDVISGIINVRGDIESVINLRRALSMPEAAPTRDSRIIIAARDGVRSGILVDSVEDVIAVPSDWLKRPLSTLDKTIREYAVGGETIYRSRYVTLLDVGKILGGARA